MFEKLLAVLALIPEPHVQGAAALIEGIVALAHKGQDTDGQVLTPERIAAIFSAALEPWARIQAKANQELGKFPNGIVTGSTGD